MSSRYDRLLELSTFSKEKLEVLGTKKVLIIGAGGVGQHISTYLVTNGIKYLTIIDFDTVELSNLNRQILLSEQDVGKYKVDVVKKALENRNSECVITAINEKIDENNIFSYTKNFDIIIDAVDNWKTKLLISKAAKNQSVPFLHIGVDGESGQFCIFKEKSLSDMFENDIVDEHRDGVMGPMVGLISSLACVKLIKFLVGEQIQTDVLYHYDQSLERIITIKI